MATHFEKKNQAIFQSASNLKPIQTTLKKIFFFIRTHKRNLKKYLHVYESQIGVRFLIGW